MKLELTFAIIKPHITSVPFRLQDIRNRILSNGFYIIKTKKETLSTIQAHEFYNEHKARENAIEVWRTMMGPTKVFKTIFTHPDSIRGVHGLSDTRNATHGSDSQESFEKEAKIFFPDFNSLEWYAKEEIKFIEGNSSFNKDKFEHITLKE